MLELHRVTNRPARLAVLVSGSGTNLQALLQSCQDSDYGAQVVGVIADRLNTGGQGFAEAAGVACEVLRLGDFPSRDHWDAALAQTLRKFEPDLVICAGFLKLLGKAVLQAFPGRIINTHNALLPAFPGIKGPADAVEYGVKYSGATLFFVDPGMDTGQIIAQCVVPVLDEDDADSLLERIKVAEREQLVESIHRLIVQGWYLRGRRVIFG